MIRDEDWQHVELWHESGTDSAGSAVREKKAAK